MRKLESFKKEIFTKEEMKTIKGGKKGNFRHYEAGTKSKCDGTTTALPGGGLHLDCGDDDNVD